MGLFKDITKHMICMTPGVNLVAFAAGKEKTDKFLDKTEDIVNKAIKNPNIVYPGGLAIALAQETKKAYDNSLRQEGYEKGVRAGNIETAKKFASLLEQSDNLRIGAFALGCHVARLGGNSDEKLSVIVDVLGEPDSFPLSPYVRSENSKIVRDKPSFGEICCKYLDSLNGEQLKSLDGFLHKIIDAGGSSSSEKSFYQYEWTPYLNRRI